MFLNGQYTPVACPFDRISCQLTTKSSLPVHALFSPIFPSLFTHLFTPYWQSPPNTLVFIIMRNPPGILDLNFVFNLYFNFHSSYMHWMSVYYHCFKFLSTSFLITSAWSTFCSEKLLPLNVVILSLKIFRAFPISILLYIVIALNLAVLTILEISLCLSI